MTAQFLCDLAQSAAIAMLALSCIRLTRRLNTPPAPPVDWDALMRAHIDEHRKHYGESGDGR